MAGITGRAGTFIVTLGRVILKDASILGIAAIVRARITILTHQGALTWRATSPTAAISQGANIAVVARLVIVYRHAAKGDIAAVGGAEVSIIASDLSARTCTLGAGVFLGAGVGVITLRRVRRKDAALFGAGIVGAGVVILAI